MLSANTKCRPIGSISTSVERSQWEDIPLDLVDVKRTESEAADRKAKLEEDAKVIADEEKIERDIAKEVSRNSAGSRRLLGRGERDQGPQAGGVDRSHQ